jgi:ABC-2 type transport system permease protein
MMQHKMLYVPQTLRRFSFQQTLRGAIIIGFISGFMLVGQGLAYEKGYPDEVSRAKFAASLSSAPALGLLYGDAKNLTAGTNGYMVYRVVGFMSLITSIWGLAVAIRLLRGNEEDNRWEIIRMSSLSSRQATTHIMGGFLLSWLLAVLLSFLITMGTIASTDLQMSIGTALIVTLMIFLPGLLLAAVGILTSQLAVTRRRALMYGLVPLLIFFIIRGIANTSHDFHWLMYFTPFGWVELVNPILDMHTWWLVLPILFSVLFAGLGIWFAERDLGASVISQSDNAHSRYYLLGNSWQLGLRQNMWVWSAWAIAALTVSSLIASLTNVANDAATSSATISKSVDTLSGNTTDIRIAFLGAGLVFLVMILMVMTANIIGAIRNDEAKQYLDTILVQPTRRSIWLVHRLLLGLGAVLFIALASGIATYFIATGQHIELNFGKLFVTSICMVGTAIFLLGFGALLYGLLPRLATPLMYAFMGWSFIIILISSAVQLNSTLLHSSLFHYVSFNLANWPDISVFIWLSVLGIIMACVGVFAFTKRDIITE